MSSNLSTDSTDSLIDLATPEISIHDYTKPVYKYTSIETAKIILETRKIRFRTPSTFNDPFEFNLDFFDRNLTNKEFKSRFDFLLREHPEISSKRRKDLLKNTSLVDFKKSYDSVIEKQRDTSLVFCTSEINDDILMWSHYANCHKGVCIGLLIPPYIPISSVSCTTMKVNYTNVINPKRFYTNDERQRNLAILQWIFTKSSCWSYEKEIRSIILNEQNKIGITNERFCDIELAKSQLKEIYFGLQTSENDIRDLTKIIENEGYNLEKKQRMKKIKNTFSIHPI